MLEIMKLTELYIKLNKVLNENHKGEYEDISLNLFRDTINEIRDGESRYDDIYRKLGYDYERIRSYSIHLYGEESPYNHDLTYLTTISECVLVSQGFDLEAFIHYLKNISQLIYNHREKQALEVFKNEEKIYDGNPLFSSFPNPMNRWLDKEKFRHENINNFLDLEFSEISLVKAEQELRRLNLESKTLLLSDRLNRSLFCRMKKFMKVIFHKIVTNSYFPGNFSAIVTDNRIGFLHYEPNPPEITLHHEDNNIILKVKERYKYFVGNRLGAFRVSI